MDDVPELYPHLLCVWSMYGLLRNSRAIGFGTIWYVPLSEIAVALDLWQVQESEWRIYYTLLLQGLDQVYVKWWMDRHGPKDGKK
jgi:hypothetical protein